MKSLVQSKLSVFFTAFALSVAGLSAQTTYNIPKSGSSNWYICGGTLYSNNGPNSDQTDGTDGTVIIYPERPGPSISISGTTTCGDNDHVYIYNGVGTDVTNIYTHDGPFWGIGDKNKSVNVLSTDASGALTFRSKNDKFGIISSSVRWNVAVNCRWAQWDALNAGGSDWGNAATKTVAATITNLGTVAFGEGFYICAFIDGVEYGRVPGNGLAPKTSTTYSIPIVVPCITGSHTLSFDIVKADENLWFSSAGYNIGATSTTITINRTPPVVTTGHSALICEGGSITLNASPNGHVYSWSGPDGFSSTDQNPAVHNISSAKFGTYTVTVTDYACSATGNVSINSMNPAPIITIMGTDVTCPGTPVSLAASSGTAINYIWSNGETQVGVTVTPTATTTYSVTGTDAVGCSARAEHTVAANLPDVTITPGRSEICVGDYATLTAGGAVGYVWSDLSGEESITVNPGNTTSYSVTGTDVHGCKNQATFSLTVHPLPDIQITGNDVVCFGDTTEITASGGVDYSWSNGDLTPTSKAYPTETATYSVTGTDIRGCMNTEEITVQVWALPDVTVSGENSICFGDNTVLRAQGTAIGYAWSTGEILSTTTVSPAESTTYSVTGTGSNGCKRKVEYAVTVNSLPTVVINGVDAVCIHDSTILSAAGAVSYVWNDSRISADVKIFPTEETTYSVTGTDENGCKNSGTHVVIVNSLPTVSILSDKNELCYGESSGLTADGAVDYTWSTLEISDNITVFPEITTTYTVTGTDLNGCKNTAGVSILVHALPDVSISGKSTICIGDNATLLANGATDYAWSNAETASAITVSPENTTIYSVVGTDIYGCKKEVDHVVVVNLLPNVAITGDAVICEGGRISLAVTGAETYEWSNNETRVSFSVYPGHGAVYSVTGTDINGCKNSDVFPVTVNPVPVVSISGNNYICEGSTVTLQAAGALEYTWFDGSTNAVTQVAPVLTTNYYVRGTDENGCTGMATHTVNVNPMPRLFVTGNEPVCRGESITLHATGANSAYVWGDGTTSATNTITPTETMLYVVRGINNGGCTAILQVPVIVKASPAIEIAAVEPICEGASAQLSVTGTHGYVWSTNETTATITVAPAATSTYTVTGTNTKGCTATAQVTVPVNPNPQVTILGDMAICEEASTQLSAFGADVYIWSTGSAMQSVTVAPGETQHYTVTGTTTYGCSATAEATVTVNPNPVLIITGNETICSGENTTLTVTGADHYSWSNAATTAAVTVMPLTSSTYRVTGTTLTGCSATAEKMITVKTSPTVSISGDNAVCLNNPATLYATGADNYVWSTGEISSSVTVNPTEMTIYTVTGTGANGCTSTAVASVDVNVVPAVTLIANTTACAGAEVMIRASGAAVYEWSTGEVSDMIVVVPVETTTYYVTGTTAAGCTSLANVTIVVSDCDITSIFTGNGSWDESALWSNGIPNEQTNAIIMGNCTVPEDYEASCKNLTLSPLTQFTVSTTASIGIHGELLMRADAGGKASYINYGNVHCLNSVKIERYVTAGVIEHFTVPIEHAVSEQYEGIELKLFDESQNCWNTLDEGILLTPGTGYTSSATECGTVLYTGSLNDQEEYIFNLSTSHCHMNAIGNMFMANITANVQDWNKTNVANGIWIWDPVNENYRTWNGERGTIDNYTIPSQHGFIVKATASDAAITLHKSNVCHEVTPVPTLTNTNVLTISATGNGRSDKAIVRFDGLTSHGWDPEYDVEKLHGSPSAPQLATNWNGKLFSINYMPRINDTILPLYFTAGVSGEYTIEVNGVPSLSPARYVRFEDTKTGYVIPITTGNFTHVFTHVYSSSDEGDRFRLIFGSPSDVKEHNLAGITIYEYDGRIMILNAELLSIENIAIYNTAGQQVYAENALGMQSRVEIGLPVSTGVYYVKLKADGKEMTQKVVIR